MTKEKQNNFPKIFYNRAADVLRIELGKGKLYDVLEMGNFLIHVNKNFQPIYLEILEASKFILQSNQVLLRSYEPSKVDSN